MPYHYFAENLYSNIKEKFLIISSRPFEHSGMTKIELNIIDRTSNVIVYDVASFDYCCEYDEFLKNKGIKHYKLTDKNHVLSYMFDIYKTVKNGNYKKVYIHGNSSLMLIEALPCKLAGARVITHCHNGKPQRGLYKYYILKPLFNIISDCKIACSKTAADWAYYGKSTVIKNGIDIDRFKFSQNTRDKTRHKLDLSENFVIGHIGTFNEQKNHKKLISIFEEIINIKPNARLLLIGDGPQKKEIVDIVKKKGLSEQVVFIDYVDNPEDYIQAMDTMIIPSLFEGFCLVALEAQVSNLPVIVSEKVPNEAIVADSCVKMHLNDSNEKWARKAIDTLDTERKDNSKLLFKKGYSLDQMIKSIENILLK